MTPQSNPRQDVIITPVLQIWKLRLRASQRLAILELRYYLQRIQPYLLDFAPCQGQRSEQRSFRGAGLRGDGAPYVYQFVISAKERLCKGLGLGIQGSWVTHPLASSGVSPCSPVIHPLWFL